MKAVIAIWVASLCLMTFNHVCGDGSGTLKALGFYEEKRHE